MTTKAPTDDGPFYEGVEIGRVKGTMAFLIPNPYSYADNKRAHEQWARGVRVGMGVEDLEGNMNLDSEGPLNA